MYNTYDILYTLLRSKFYEISILFIKPVPNLELWSLGCERMPLKFLLIFIKNKCIIYYDV